MLHEEEEEEKLRNDEEDHKTAFVFVIFLKLVHFTLLLILSSYF